MAFINLYKSNKVALGFTDFESFALSFHAHGFELAGLKG